MNLYTDVTDFTHCRLQRTPIGTENASEWMMCQQRSIGDRLCHKHAVLYRRFMQVLLPARWYCTCNLRGNNYSPWHTLHFQCAYSCSDSTAASLHPVGKNVCVTPLLAACFGSCFFHSSWPARDSTRREVLQLFFQVQLLFCCHGERSRLGSKMRREKSYVLFQSECHQVDLLQIRCCSLCCRTVDQLVLDGCLDGMHNCSCHGVWFYACLCSTLIALLIDFSTVNTYFFISVDVQLLGPCRSMAIWHWHATLRHPHLAPQ